MPTIRFQSLLRSPEIGANSYCLEFGHTRVLLDCGMHPKQEGRQATPNLAELKDLRVDAAIISHSHLDHIGSLPIFQRMHPEADIIMTPPTAQLAEAMLHNSVNVMTARRTEAGLTEYPLFTHPELDRMTRTWGYRVPGRPFDLGPDHVKVTFYEAGHIMGSVGVLFEHGGQRIFYTGDVQLEDQTLMKAAELPEGPVDVLIMETTRGAKATPEGFTREAETLRFAQAITETLNRGGSVLLPVFAMGKSQEVLLMMHELKTKGLLPRFPPMHFGGLATRMTQITDKLADETRRRHPGLRLLDMKDLVQPLERVRRHSPAARKSLNYAPGRVYALSSGMMTENTASNEFAFQFIDNPKNALLFVGYCDPDSPGGHILRASKGDAITLNRENSPVPLRCQVDAFGFSGHSPRESLVEMAVKFQPKKILLVHGDAPATEWFQEQLALRLPDTEIIIPGAGEILPLAD